MTPAVGQQQHPALAAVDNQDQAEALIQRARSLLYQGSLVEVVANREAINDTVSQLQALVGFGGIPEDLWEMLTMLDDIVAGKVDRVAALIKVGIPAQRAALAAAFKEQDERAALAGSRLEGLLFEAVKLGGRGSIVGMFWKARSQDNSNPSVVVEDYALVPVKLKRRRFVMKFDFPAGSARLEKEIVTLVAKWRADKATILGVSGLSATLEDLVPAKPIADAWKAGDPKARPVVPGVQVIMGSHMRIEGVKGKPGDIVQPIPLKLAPAPAAEGSVDVKDIF